MNDTEQYHTGRAAAYATAERYLSSVLHQYKGDIPRDIIDSLHVTFGTLQLTAEQAAERSKSPTPA